MLDLCGGPECERESCHPLLCSSPMTDELCLYSGWPLIAQGGQMNLDRYEELASTEIELPGGGTATYTYVYEQCNWDAGTRHQQVRCVSVFLSSAPSMYIMCVCA